MAIDTAKKRRMALMTAVRLVPAPDGTIDATDRAGVTGIYAESLAVPVVIYDHLRLGIRLRL